MKTVYEGGEGEIVEKKSRFIATVKPVGTEEEAVAFIEEMKKLFKSFGQHLGSCLNKGRGCRSVNVVIKVIQQFFSDRTSGHRKNNHNDIGKRQLSIACKITFRIIYQMIDNFEPVQPRNLVLQ